LWACDFFTRKVWTLTGFVELFVLFFIQVGSRKVHVAGITVYSGALAGRASSMAGLPVQDINAAVSGNKRKHRGTREPRVQRLLSLIASPFQKAEEKAFCALCPASLRREDCQGPCRRDKAHRARLD
jgi:hypothetical protein